MTVSMINPYQGFVPFIYDPFHQAFNVKPAIFDLILAIGIALYLLAVFLVVSQFHVLKSAIQPAVYPYLNGVNGKASSPLRNGHAKKM